MSALTGPEMFLYLLLAFVFAAFAAFIMFIVLQPAASLTVSATKYAETGAFYISALSGIDEGFATLSLFSYANVSVIYEDSKHFFVVSLSPEEKHQAQAMILTYPEKKQQSVLISLEHVNKVCIRKKKEEKLAMVEAC
ncbi:MAG: hypothetical protein KKA90_02055 [Nanoarchaeota archaeon]|nr:hypothetical protein [Nanoarchaeota archaeon]